MEPDLICKFHNYEITGTAKILAWDNSKGFIKMDSCHTTDISDLKKYINDGGFGCKRILNAHINIYNTYTNNAKTFNKEEYIEIDSPVTDKDVQQYDEFEFYNNY